MAVRRSAVRVLFDDGHDELIIIKPLAAVATERKFKGDVPVMEGTLWAAWYSQKKPMNNFDAWVSKLDAVEEVVVGADGNVIEDTTDDATGGSEDTTAAPEAPGATTTPE